MQLPICPKNKSRSYKAGWKAKLASKPIGACRIRIDNGWDWSTYSAAGERIDEWERGWRAARRALGKMHKAEREAEEIKKINQEHDSIADLAEELGL